MTESYRLEDQFVLVVDYRGKSDRHPLRRKRSIVGRAKDCDIVLDDGSVSRQHAALDVVNGRVRVVDLGSRNRTFLNGRPVDDVDLEPGDTVTFGSIEGTIQRDETVELTEPGAIRHLKDFHVTGQNSVIDVPRLMHLLAEIARTLVGTLTLQEILGRVIDLLFANIRAERACLLMLNPATAKLEPVLMQQAGGGAAEGPAISRTAIATAIKLHAAILTVDALGDRRFDAAQSIRLGDIRSLMCAPLFAGEQVIGALYVDNALAHQFSEADLELFTGLTNYAAVAIAKATLADQLTEERSRRERLQRYHSPAVVDRILASHGDNAQLPAQELDISVLFADIVEFTAIAESMRPADVATLLNTFLSRTVEAVFGEQGTIDKFLGDAILAVFGAPVQQADHALRAVKAAQAMREIVSVLNAERLFPPLRVRYAINSGVAIVGDIGSARRQEYTVLGDVVNIASRLKTMAEPDQLVVSRATYERIHPPLGARPLGEFAVRGRIGNVEVWSVDR